MITTLWTFSICGCSYG